MERLISENDCLGHALYLGEERVVEMWMKVALLSAD